MTFTSTFTNADGSVGTSTGTLQSATAVPIKQNNSSNAGKVWGIVGGVVGVSLATSCGRKTSSSRHATRKDSPPLSLPTQGVVAILIGAFVVYRLTQRRFSDLDDHVDEIKWPELQPDGQTVSTATSTLKPLDTHRTGGAGIGDDGDEDDWDSSEPFMAAQASASAGAGAGAGGDRRYSSGTLLSMSQNAHDASYEQLAMVDQGGYASQYPGQGAGGGGAHYDPFLGPSAAPYPPPQNVSYPPSPFSGASPSSRSPSLGGGGSPNLHQGPMGAPGAGGAIRQGSPPPPSTRDPFAAAASMDGFRAHHSGSPHSVTYGGNHYRGGPL